MKMLTAAQMKKNWRLTRAQGVKQAMLCIALQGYVIEHNKRMTADEYRAQFLADLQWRITRKMGNRLNWGSNAERAADIVRLGAKSRWWFARESTESAGDDRRGITWYLKKWARERGLKPPA